MENYRKIAYWIVKIFIPNLLLAAFVFSTLYYRENIRGSTYLMLFIGMVVYFFARLYYYYYKVGFFLWNNLKSLSQVIGEFKKGKFVLKDSDIDDSILVSGLLKELLTVGKQFDSIVSSQSDELKKFHEIYSHIICSIDSHFIVIDKFENIIYANEGFCRKFNIDPDTVVGKGLDSIFYFINTRLKIGISHIKGEEGGDSVVLKNVHLMSVNRISIIADIKISSMVVNSEDQIAIIIDDITDRFSKDYQTSILTHITGTLGDEIETDNIFYNILFGVTSGSGLGFNRAMLFLVEDGKLKGKMAVGPDSFEEAIEVWNSISSSERDLPSEYPVNVKKSRLLERVLEYSVDADEDNIFTRAVREMDRFHVRNSFEDSRVSDGIREFMEVDEFVIVPLISFKKTIGIIVADNKYNMTEISQQNEDLLTIFSYQAASLIESYLNLIEVREEMEKLEERQEAIIESEKMAAVGRIASHIAHEIRNPLVTMGGYAKRISKYASSGSGDEKKIIKSADIILRESERLEKILSNVMDFTRPSKYIKEFNDINHIIKDTFSLLRNFLDEKKISVKMNMEKDLPHVKSDFNQLKQVLLNLFQNAIDATPPGGKIEIKTRSDESSVTICFTDSGIGIEEKNVELIFDPFFTTKVTGVGLGLANVKKIIMDHKGKISVLNREEGGTEFIIRLPLPLLEQKNGEKAE